MDVRIWNWEIRPAKFGLSGDRQSQSFYTKDLAHNIENCHYKKMFKAIEDISARLALGDILYTNTIAGGIIFEDFVAMFYFSNTDVAQ